MSLSTPQRTITAQPTVKVDNFLGEGPLWHPTHQMLYWVNIEYNEVHGLEPHTNRHRVWEVPKKIGAVVSDANGNLIVALQGEIAVLDPVNGRVRSLVELESDIPHNRCNDGKCDPAGRFWIGTMNFDCKPGAGSLYCIDSKLNVTKVLSGLTISNGMGWSPDGAYMYFIDSADHEVKRFNFDPKNTSLEEGKIILRFEKQEELPDGMCVDSEGMLWIAFWGGHRVGRYDPATGRHLADIQVAAPHVTSCCFGDQDLQTLYITTAREGLTREQLQSFPLSGSLFSCRPGITGSEANIFGLKA